MNRNSLLGIHTLFLLLALASSSLASSAPQDPLKAVATLPDIADLVREIGGTRVQVKTICKGTENVHAVRLKPSHVVMTSRCEAFFQVGLSLEHAWVPGLVKTSRNRKIQAGKPGLVTVSEGMTVTDPTTRVVLGSGVSVNTTLVAGSSEASSGLVMVTVYCRVSPGLA